MFTVLFWAFYCILGGVKGVNECKHSQVNLFYDDVLTFCNIADMYRVEQMSDFFVSYRITGRCKFLKIEVNHAR